MNEYVDTTKVTLRLIDKKLAKEMIEKYHYSHSWTSCRYALGIFYRTDIKHKFLNNISEKLIGVMVYGHPVGRTVIESISPLLGLDNVLELTRLFIDETGAKNIESYCIGLSHKWMKENDKNIKVLVSYSDPEVGHVGTIYQATNAIYQGNDFALMDNYAVSLSDKPFAWIHSRTVSERFGSHNVEHLKRVIGKTFWMKVESEKYRYIWILSPDRKEKKNILKTLKYPPKPYPKTAEHLEQITKVEV